MGNVDKDLSCHLNQVRIIKIQKKKTKQKTTLWRSRTDGGKYSSGRRRRGAAGPNVLLHCHLEEKRGTVQEWLNVFLTDLGVLLWKGCVVLLQ